MVSRSVILTHLGTLPVSSVVWTHLTGQLSGKNNMDRHNPCNQSGECIYSMTWQVYIVNYNPHLDFYLTFRLGRNPSVKLALCMAPCGTTYRMFQDRNGMKGESLHFCGWHISLAPVPCRPVWRGFDSEKAGSVSWWRHFFPSCGRTLNCSFKRK